MSVHQTPDLDEFDLGELDRLTGFADPVHEAESCRYIGPPQPNDGMYYGKIGEWSRLAVAKSEAPRPAVFITLVAYAATALGRHCHLWIDNTAHHPRLFAIHIGRTARGRKGTAVGVTERLHKAILALDDAEAASGSHRPRTAPAVHVGGLSTREGLAWVLRDPSEVLDDDGNPTDPGQPDKRLLAIESEFDNVLEQGRRDGNTLSSALRDCFDGRDLAPLTKSNRTRATEPHVNCVGHITPHEMLNKLDGNSINNGFLNRFLVFWAERTRLVPFPEPLPRDTIDQWACDLYEAVKQAQDGDGEMVLGQQARALYKATYLGEWSHATHSELITALLERSPVIALRLAMTLALIDGRRTISAKHLQCGIEWTRYWRASVEYIWRDRARLASTDGAEADLAKRADKIMGFLRTTGVPVSRAELLSHCFNRNLKASDLDAVLEWMQLNTPPLIAITQVPKRGKRSNQTVTMVEIVKHPREHDEHDEHEATTRARSHSYAYEHDEHDPTATPSHSSHSYAYEHEGDPATASPSSPSSPSYA